jgi:thiol-disulfide isomerase/thioredoxin
MRTFDTQLEFETYWEGKAEPVKPAGVRTADKAFVVYFTATWCGACKRLDLDAVEATAKAVGLPIWKVEQTVNDYTAGFCAVRSLPTFILCTPKKIVSRLSSSATEDVVAWLAAATLTK